MASLALRLDWSLDFVSRVVVALLALAVAQALTISALVINELIALV